MKESASIALSYLRSVQHKYRFLNEDLNSINYHVHIPEGAIPKDGPSAGITLAVSLFSTLSGLPTRAQVAMTGELTLTGRVLPIGGLKEKVLAAIRGGMKLVVLPEANRPEWKELCAESDSGAELRTSLDVCFVEDAEAVFKTLFDI
jgi:ATP-dependent Lon protease